MEKVGRSSRCQLAAIRCRRRFRRRWSPVT